jgi:hypothetical protein
MPRISVCVVPLVLALPLSVLAGEVTYQFRTREDPKAAEPNLCQDAPFQANVKLQGLVSVPEKDARGKLKPGEQKGVGTAHACSLITDRAFSEGSQADMYASFELPEGHFAAVGKCTAVSNAVPRPGVVLVGCALKLTEFPKAYAGGFATSASIFNPRGLPGYDTGSLWTLRLFEPEPVAVAAPGAAVKPPEKTPAGTKAPAPAPAPTK